MNTKIVLIISVFIVFLFLHHYYIHRSDKNKSFFEKWFQLSDVDNHETIIVGLIIFIIALLLFA